MTNEAGINKNGQVEAAGRKSLAPLLAVLSRHKGDFSPYLEALSKALRSAADSLKTENATEADSFISTYFSEGAEWLGQWKDKINLSSSDEVIHLLEEEGRKRPALLFGASYFGGLILGRFGRHLGKTMKPNVNIH